MASFGNATFYMFAAITLLSFVLVARFVPETRGKSLEKLEAHLEKEPTPDAAA